MALHPLRTFLFAATVAALPVFALAACGDDDDSDTSPTATAGIATPTPQATEATATVAASTATSTPPRPSGTTTPTPEAAGPAGFRAALEQFNKELNAGTVDPIVSRVKVVEYTCKETDLQNVLGANTACKAAGEVIRGVQTSTWRSEGALRPVDAFVENLKGYQAGFDTSKSDAYGAGAFRVYAFDPTKNIAVITVISKCLPDRQCPASGFQRLVWVPTFELIDGRWKIASLTYAFVLGEDFLDPSAEGKNRMPGWTKFE